MMSESIRNTKPFVFRSLFIQVKMARVRMLRLHSTIQFDNTGFVPGRINIFQRSINMVFISNVNNWIRFSVLSAVAALCHCSIQGLTLDRPGTLYVSSSESAQYYLLDLSGNYLTPQGCFTNKDYPIPPGNYNLMLNGSILDNVQVESNSQTVEKTGGIRFDSFAPTNITIAYPDSSYRSFYFNQAHVGLFPGTYSIKINGRTFENLTVVADETVQISTGILNVTCPESGRYILSDGAGRILGSYEFNRPVMLTEDIYSITINGSSRKLTITSGDETCIPTGTMWVSGSGNGSFSFSDVQGHILKSNIPVNTVVPVLPGNYIIEMCKVSKPDCIIGDGTETGIFTGSVWIKGNGFSSFYLCDSLGKHLQSYPTGKQLDLFEGKYLIEICRIRDSVSIRSGTVAELETGSLIMNGESGEAVSLYDERRQILLNTYPVNTEIELYPGTYYSLFSTGKRDTIIVKAGVHLQISSI